MPGLISRKEFKRVTGLTDEDIRELVKAGELRIWRRPDSKIVDRGLRIADCKKGKKKAGHGRGVYARYLTVEAARLCGFDLTKV